MSLNRRLCDAAIFALIACGISVASAQVNNPGLFQSGAVTVGHLASWGPGAGQLQDSGAVAPTPSALTKADDTNVTITLTGTPATALLQAVQLNMGWTGTLAAARLNANVVQAVANDTNVTGVIAAQSLQLGWTGTLAAVRLNANVVQSFASADVTGVIAAQQATLTVAKFSGNVLPVTAGADSQILIGSGASNFIFSTIPNCPGGTLQYTSATHLFNCAASGSGTVTSVTCNGVAITTSGVCSTIGQVPGTATNDNAAAGFVGEYNSSIVLAGSAVSLVTNVAKDITTLTLTAGDWDVSGICVNQPNPATTTSAMICNITTTANTLNNAPSDGGAISFSTIAIGAGLQQSLTTDVARVSISGSTTYHLVMQATFLINTEAGYGKIRARRVR